MIRFFFRRLGLSAVLFAICALDLRGALKLALWSERGLENLSFTLGAKLSRSDQDRLDLVERNQVSKIIAEAKLGASGLGVEQAASTCHLLGADALLWLERLEIGDRRLLLTRLVAARSGVVVGWRLDETLPEDPAAWADLVRSGLTKWLEKLPVPPERAITVSLLNLRETGRSSPTPVGPMLNRLLAGELSSRPEVFVLERRRMEDLALENELLGETTPAFWNGAWLLDGSFTQAGGILDLQLRLRSANGRESLWREQGAPDAALIARLSAEILRRMGAAATAARWDPTAEAREFFAEALWAERWELGRPMIESIEAAIALGLASPDAQRLRYLAYGFHSTEAPRHRILEHGYFTVNHLPSGPCLSPGADRLADARHAFALFEDVRRGSAGAALSARPAPESHSMDRPRRVPWHENDAGTLLLHAARLLATAYHASLTDEEQELARELRADARALFKSEWASLAPELTLRDPDSLQPAPRGGRAQALDSLAAIALVGGVYWSEQPDGHAALIRTLLAADLQGHRLLYDELLLMLPVVQWRGWEVDWTTRDAAKARAFWKDFFGGCANDPDLGFRLAGALWPLGRKWPLTDKDEIARRNEEAWRFLIRHFEAFGAGRLPAQYARELLQATHAQPAAPLRKDAVSELLRVHALPASQAPALAALVSMLSLRPDELERLRKIQSSSPADAAVGTPPPSPPPPLRPSVLQASLPLRAAWIQQAPGTASARDKNHRQKLLWASLEGDRLWLIVYNDPENIFAHEEGSMALLRLDLPLLDVNPILSWTAPWREMTDLYQGYPAYAIVGDTLFHWAGNHIVKRHLAGGPAQPLDLPIDKRPRLWAAGDKLHAGLNHGGVLRIEPKTGAWELLADSRRRPGDGLLSDCPPYRVENIWQSADGVLHLMRSMDSDVFSYDEIAKNWTAFPGWEPPFPAARFDHRAALRSFHHMEQASSAHRARELAMLASDVHRIGLCDGNVDFGRHFGAETSPVVDGVQRTAWNYLSGTVEGETLWALFNHPWEKNRAPHLVRLPPAPSERLSIRLDQPANELARITPPGVDDHEGGFFGEAPRILVSPHGLFIYSPGGPVLWHLSRASLESVGVIDRP